MNISILNPEILAKVERAVMHLEICDREKDPDGLLDVRIFLVISEIGEKSLDLKFYMRTPERPPIFC